MIKRKNKVFAKIIKKGIEMSRRNHNRSAGIMMTKAGIPYTIIDRDLYAHDKLRSSD